MEKWYLHIDMDAFFASVEIASRPYLSNKPVAVGGSSNTRSVVAAASYNARKYGIHAGMSSMEASIRCPSIVMIKPDMKKYASVSKQIFKMIKSYTGNVSIYSIDECFVLINGEMEHAGYIAKYIKNRVEQEYKITCSIGIGENKLIAKIASNDNKPNGITLVKNAKQYIRSKHVSDIPGIGRKTTKALAALGIHYVSDIAVYPLYSLKKHFKSYAYVLKEIAEARNASNILWNIESDLKSVGNTHTMDKDIYSLDDLKSMLSIISEHIALRMQESGVEGNIVCLTIRYANFFTFTKRQKIYKYIHFPEDILIYANNILLSIELKMKVRLIGISISGLQPINSQLSFPFSKNEKSENLKKVINDIKLSFGEWSLMRASSLRMRKREFMHFGGIDKRKENKKILDK